MEITHTINGTLTLDPGVSVNRAMDIPAGFPTDGPNRRFSRVTPLDPADLPLFRFEGFTSPALSSRDNYAGVHQFALVYTLTGPDPIDVEFDLVFVVAAEPVNISYGGV